MPTTPTLTTLSYPVNHSSAHGDLVYVIKSNEYITTPGNYPNFKYILDIFINGGTTFIGTLKANPNPVTKFGAFNIGNIVRNYVDSNLIPTGYVESDTLENYSMDIEVQFGYEYGVIVTQTHNVSAQDNIYFNHYNGRMYGNYTIIDPYIDNFASNRPDKTNVLIDQSLFLPYLPSGDSVISSENMTVTISTFNSSFGAVSTGSFTTPYSTYKIKQFDLNPLSINARLGSALINQNTYAFRINISARNSEGTRISVYSKYFILTCESKYTPHTLVFLNKLGGYDSFTFTKVSKKSYDIEKKDYSQLPYTINSSTGAMSYYNGAALNDNQITYYGTFKEKLIVNTDIINESVYTWLGELITSPQIYSSENGYLVPVMIKQTNFEFKTRINDKAFNLQVELEYGDLQNVQYR